MALARLRGGPLDGQILPLDDTEQEELIVPYGTTQVIYQRSGEPTGTGQGDGPTEVQFWFADASDDIVPSDD
ncbi:response regulator [Microbacterium sp. NIBRBAC000506063]|uniref:response regulator n=1 Tax=Microbacterium sp. NIBRBAC000506063 TaxID=2734618 RepID=UPI001BB53DBC|nr:response regulator [Microbacterium sp. NIBRBAC000506063]QTV80933.1 response regulator [Microbacterium sp. NIBRBAC000506063]